MQGIWETYLTGNLEVGDALDGIILRSARALTDKGYWMWLFTSAGEEASL